MTSPARSPRPNIQKVHDAGDEDGPSALQEEASGRRQGGRGGAPGPALHQGEEKHRCSGAVRVTQGRAVEEGGGARATRFWSPSQACSDPQATGGHLGKQGGRLFL